jgi:hypothetical protein
MHVPFSEIPSGQSSSHMFYGCEIKSRLDVRQREMGGRQKKIKYVTSNSTNLASKPFMTEVRNEIKLEAKGKDTNTRREWGNIR